jgi:hypothetical protein
MEIKFKNIVSFGENTFDVEQPYVERRILADPDFFKFHYERRNLVKA